MSFQDIIHGLDAAGRLPPPPAPPPLHTVVSHAVFQINTKSAELWHLADALASCRGDARAIRERIRRTRAEATRLARNTARKLAAGGDDAVTAAEVGPKLAADFEAALRDLQRAQQRVIAADRQETAAASAAFLAPFFSPPAPTTSYASPSRTGPYNGGAGTWDDHHQRNVQLQQQLRLVESRRTQELVHLENEVTFNEALVQEREQEIVKIQQEITEINEIFRDLAVLVHGQHEAIDIVESNLSAAASETGKAEVELRKAATAQKTISETDCLLRTAVGLVVFILILLFTLC